MGLKTARATRAVLLAAAVALILPFHAWGHGFAGKRFFPATLTFDDPFVLDEFGLSANHFRAPGEAGGTLTTNSLSADFAKRITNPLMFAVGTTLVHQSSSATGSHTGFDNMEVGVKYLTFVSPSYETLLATGFYADVGNTGSASIGAEPFSTVSPSIFFGQGFGALSNDTVPYLRPLAISGIVQPNIPLEKNVEDTLLWGFSVQYNVEYLEDFVKYVGLNAPFKHLVPIVELPMTSCLNHGCGGRTTGTVNPGFIWWGSKGQVALEASLPINKDSGTGVGVVVQMDLYLDDLFPNTLGTPIFKR